eukprot:5188114-Amphidinium_carterae.1
MWKKSVLASVQTLFALLDSHICAKRSGLDDTYVLLGSTHNQLEFIDNPVATVFFGRGQCWQESSETSLCATDKVYSRDVPSG